MKITALRAYALEVPATLDITEPPRQLSHQICVVEIDTDAGITGHGLTTIGLARPIRTMVLSEAAPLLIDQNPLAHEKLFDLLYWGLAPKGQTGTAMHAISAIDIALWDIKGKALNMPIYQLLGGARNRCQIYATFGFGVYDKTALGEAAKAWQEAGFHRLKMTVANGGLKRRDEPRPLKDLIEEDVSRVAVVREAIGADAELFIDANCSLDLYHAQELCHKLAPFGIAFFEEPITQNDNRAMADLRARTSMRLACGQNEAQLYRFRDMLIAGAVDILQPNVAISGGFTQCQKIAALANSFNISVDNGGAWPYVNMHLQAGVSNGGLVEYHASSVAVCQQIYTNLPRVKDGYIHLPDAPGLGYDLNPGALPDFEI